MQKIVIMVSSKALPYKDQASELIEHYVIRIGRSLKKATENNDNM